LPLKKPDNTFMLFACCVPVKGNQRGVIYDLQRGKFKYIPAVFYDLLLLTGTKTVAEIKTVYSNESDKVIDDFFDSLAAEQWGFYTSTPGFYPALSMQWDYPSQVSCCIAEYIVSRPGWNLPSLMMQLDTLQTVLLQLRLFDAPDCNTITSLLPLLKESSLSGAELLINWFPGMDFDLLFEYMLAEHRITKLIVHSMPPGIKVTTNKPFDEFLRSRTAFTTQVFRQNEVAEKIKIESFVVNTEFFTEAHNYNAGLNRKLAVDGDGNIKNYTSHSRVLGNMNTHTLAQAIENSRIAQHWAVHNDHIIKCKDCEYRYMCMDNTEVVSRDGEWHKAADCGYNPYTAQWNEP
jgi:SPASM domain peptide maturase of grasp-with-spasm system